MTSKWVRMVAAQRDYTVDWRFISLRLINSAVDYDSHFPAGYEEGHTSGLRLLRVAARTRAEHGRAAVGPFYEAISSEIFDAPGRRADPLDRGSRAFVEPLLAAAGLPADLADALDDTRVGRRRSAPRPTRRSLLTGRDVGTPIIHFSPAGRHGVLRPGDQQAPRPRGRRPALGPRHRAWPPSPASPSSSGACASGPSCAASASTPTRPERRKTGTPAAARRCRSPVGR